MKIKQLSKEDIQDMIKLDVASENIPITINIKTLDLSKSSPKIKDTPTSPKDTSPNFKDIFPELTEALSNFKKVLAEEVKHKW